MNDKNSTKRFSNRVQDYVKYRPSYPKEIVQLISQHCHGPTKQAADMGGGTGIFTKLLLDANFNCTLVEPNGAMLEAARDYLKEYNGVNFIERSAEDTGIDENSCDVVCAAQAYHWFDHKLFIEEALRILKPQGIIALIWNERKTEASGFLVDYEKLINRYSTDYKEVNHTNFDEASIRENFSQQEVTVFHRSISQFFDFGSLRGRLFSSSYMPSREDREYPKICSKLEELYHKYQIGGKVEMMYDCTLYIIKQPRQTG